MEERKMTIARGLTRLKTINAQIVQNNDVLTNACVSSKKKSVLADMKLDLPENHKKAKEVVQSAMQSNEALFKEFIKIKNAITKANLTTLITVAGETMTIAEAMVLRQEVAGMAQQTLNTYSSSMNRVNAEVQRNNDTVMGNSNISADDKKFMLADTVSFVSYDKMTEMNKFINVFLAEVDGTLNEVNALTEIEV